MISQELFEITILPKSWFRANTKGIPFVRGENTDGDTIWKFGTGTGLKEDTGQAAVFTLEGPEELVIDRKNAKIPIKAWGQHVISRLLTKHIRINERAVCDVQANHNGRSGLIYNIKGIRELEGKTFKFDILTTMRSGGQTGTLERIK